MSDWICGRLASLNKAVISFYNNNLKTANSRLIGSNYNNTPLQLGDKKHVSSCLFSLSVTNFRIKRKILNVRLHN